MASSKPISKPIPLLAPVMMAVLFVRSQGGTCKVGNKRPKTKAKWAMARSR